LLGRIVDMKKINTIEDSNKVNYSVSNFNMGIYKYRLMDDQNKMYTGTFIIK